MKLRQLFLACLTPLVLLGGGCETKGQSLDSAQPGTTGQALTSATNTGRNMMAGIIGAAPLVENDRLHDYVNRVGHWVALQSGRPDLRWTFAVLDTPHINAFAAPGGYIAITLGYYQLLQTEDQLAAVLARQIAHVDQRHPSSALEQLIPAASLKALQQDADKLPRKDIHQPLKQALQLYVHGFYPGFEFTADREAMTLTTRAGYDPFALLDVLITLSSIDPGDDSVRLMLATRPEFSQRIENLAILGDRHFANFEIVEPGDRLRRINLEIARQP